MSLSYAIYNGNTRILKYSNAGSPPLIVCRGGKAEILSVQGFPLGLFDEAEYREIKVALNPGDCVIFYTDGLLEARDLRAEEFGVDRLKEAVARHSSLPVKRLVDKILSEIEQFSLDNRKYDDQTIVALKAT